jgi:outer membrane protein
MKKTIVILLFILSNIAFGQDVMTYQDCLNLALKNNLQLKSALNSEKIAKYQYTASYGKLLPNFFGSLDNRNTWGREVDPQTNLFVNTDIKNYIGYINANYNLFAGFSALNSIRYSKQEFKINQENIKRVENVISISLAEKFITILYLQEIISANQEQIKSSEKQLEVALLKFNAGSIAESEVFKIKSQKATEELNLLTNQNRLTDNMVSIKQLMNIPLEKEIVLIKPIMKLDNNIAIEQSPYDIINKAILINPSYKISLLREKKARAALAVARSTKYPLLTMRAQYGANYTNTDEVFDFNEQLKNNEINILRLNLIIPIFSQMDNYSKSKTSKMLYKQSKVDTEIAKNELSKEVMKAITDTKTSIKKNEASSIAFEFSEKSYEADALKFELGKININELNVTKATYINSQAQLIQSKYELLYNNALIKFYLGEAFSL